MMQSLRTLTCGLLVAGLATICGVPAVLAGSLAETFAAHQQGSTSRIDHSAWNGLLKSYVVPGSDGLNRVDYRRFKSEGHAQLKNYIQTLSQSSPSNLDKNEQFSFWANLYNAKTIDVVLDAYPVNSIKDISLGGGLVAAVTGGPWKAKVVKVAGIDLSLDDIEHAILRPIFKDPRVHYAVNCASIGCPNLGTEAFEGTRLESQLENAARAFVNHPRGASVSGDGLTVSSIYSWFQVDFEGDDAGVLRHLRRYADGTLKSKLEGITAIDDFRYDWKLNDISR